MTLKDLEQGLLQLDLTPGSPRERLYLLARIDELLRGLEGQAETIAQLRRDVAFEKAVNERVGQVVVDMFKKLQS